MKNISYFCIVKRFKSILKIVFCCLPLVLGGKTTAAAQSAPWRLSPTNMTDAQLDSVRISLLTCSPHDEIYSLYGHTAIRLENPAYGVDAAINYGMFSFSKPYFVARFVFGLTDYEMGVVPFAYFCEEYRSYGSKVTQQVINLKNSQKRRIIQALEDNYQPENRVYRYNYFYDNCTTRARDMILQNLQDDSTHVIGKSHTEPLTYRDMVHACTAHHPWARFGNDMLLGLMADRLTTNEQQQFLPANLMGDFDEMLISDNRTYEAPLVLDKLTVVPEGQQFSEGGFPLSPTACALILLAVTLLVVAYEWLAADNVCWAYDAVLMVLSGLAGCLLFLMLFSQHPTVRLNLQMLVLNPLPLFFLWRAVKRARRGQRDPWWMLWGALIVLFFVGAFLQRYAEGMMILALCLLIRCVVNTVATRKSKV